jgi:hypothetical protein
MQKLDKIKEVKVAEQSIEVDPRSKTTADQAFNYIATGKPEMPVGGQKRMLAEKRIKLFFEMFSQLPSWFTNLWILVVASIYGIKGTQIFRNGGKK